MIHYQRTGHKIKLNHANHLPRYIISLGVDIGKHYADTNHLRVTHSFDGCTIVCSRYQSSDTVGKKTLAFDTTDALWEYVFSYTKPNFTTWLIGHDILYKLILCGLPSRFQHSELHIDKPRAPRKQEDNHEDEPFTQGLAVIEGPPTIIGCRVARSQGRLVIIDTLNWFSAGIPTGTTAAEPESISVNSTRYADNRTIGTSAEQAELAHSTFIGLIKLVSDNELGNFKYTASGQAMAAFRHRFMEQNIYVHDNNTVQKQERQAYFGGRSEMFRKGINFGACYLLDANSLFPYIMRNSHLPYCLTRNETRLDYLEILPAIDWSASVAEVEIDTPKAIFPLRTNSCIIYPRGIFRTSLCGMELYQAFRMGAIRKVRSWSEYKLAVLFRRWVDDLFAIRQRYQSEGNAQYATFTKKLLNSLYGKFAQLSPNWQNEHDNKTMLPWTTESRLDPRTGEWVSWRSIGWQAQKMVKRTELPGSFYAISAFVTTAARCHMNHLRSVAGRRNVYYQGVDSLVVNKYGYRNLESDGELSDSVLGKLRVEHTAEHCDIRGISDYEIGDHTVLSGRSAVVDTTDHGEVLAHRRYIEQHLFRNGPIDTVEERLESWLRTSQYNKGDVQADGWVEPFTLGSPPTSEMVGSNPELPAVASAAST